MNTPDPKLHAPSEVEAQGNIDRHGVRRTSTGRPFVKVPCPGECDAGRVPGKRPGTTKQCPKKCDAGVKEAIYTRCTSFVGALEDRQNLEKWQRRIVLLGVAADHRASEDESRDLLARLAATDPDDREALDVLAELAYELGDGYRRAEQGTSLHGMTEKLEAGELIPEATLTDRRDLAAYVKIRERYGIETVSAERFVVEHEHKIAGTYDRRVVSSDPRMLCEVCDTQQRMIEVGAPLPKVLDLKTGRVDYGGGKMRQQLAVYAYSLDYDPKTGETSTQDVCRHIGFVLHLPQGEAEAEVYRLDLEAGWQDVQLSAEVRRHRRETARGVLTPLGLEVTP